MTANKAWAEVLIQLSDQSLELVTDFKKASRNSLIFFSLSQSSLKISIPFVHLQFQTFKKVNCSKHICLHIILDKYYTVTLSQPIYVPGQLMSGVGGCAVVVSLSAATLLSGCTIKAWGSWQRLRMRRPMFIKLHMLYLQSYCTIAVCSDAQHHFLQPLSSAKITHFSMCVLNRQGFSMHASKYGLFCLYSEVRALNLFIYWIRYNRFFGEIFVPFAVENHHEETRGSGLLKRKILKSSSTKFSNLQYPILENKTKRYLIFCEL